jgi:hypothetical protein
MIVGQRNCACLSTSCRDKPTVGEASVPTNVSNRGARWWFALAFAAACSSHHPAAVDVDANGGDAGDAADGAISGDAAPDALVPSTARIWTHFNFPRAHGGSDATIANELVRMIDATPAGELIRGNFFELAYPSISTALNAAYDRGVQMRITLDGSPTNRAFAEAQSVATHMGVYAGFCGGPDTTTETQGCITTTVGGIAHIKFLTFSKTRAPDGEIYPDVSWFGSFNSIDCANGDSGDCDSNSATSIYDSPVSYQQLSEHQVRMQAQLHYPDNDYFDPPRGYFYDANAHVEAFLSPENGPNLVLDQLERITGDSSCIVRVFQASFSVSMVPTAQRLATLEGQGCQVFVLVDVIDPTVASTLTAAGIEIRPLTGVHDKLFLIDAKYDGSTTNRQLVFTGSHNWENKASYGNDELLASIEDPTQYQLFYAHFLDGWHAAAPSDLPSRR